MLVCCVKFYFHQKKKNNLYIFLEKLLKLYSLPTSLHQYNLKISKQKLIDKIYNSIFLDKKKINKFPRYIGLKKMYNPVVKEIDDTGKMLEVIKLFV